VAPYLTPLRAEAGQRSHALREVYDALRWLVRVATPWWLLPPDFPPWHAVYDQTWRGLL
jgi:transposase